MADAAPEVDVIGRLAQWEIDGGCYIEADAFTFKVSDPFKINGYDWKLAVFKRPSTCFRLSLEPSQFPENQLPFVRFVLRVTGPNREPLASQMYEKVPHPNGQWYCPMARIKNLQSSFFSVEIIDIKISLPNGTVGSSILHNVDKPQHLSTRSSSRSFSQMLDDSVHADITIFTSDGKLRAHKAVLSTSSPIFRSMFTHDLKEKITGTIEIKDMTSESCMAFLRFLYGSVKQEEFWEHRLVLLGASIKYGITDLKEACEESFLEDIDADNVLDRLQEAWLYEAGKLKRGCFRFLFDFGMIHHVSKEKMHDFIRKADRELAVEMFDKIFKAGVAPLGTDTSVNNAKRLKVPSTE
ncbi:hypothetical protein CASFOL_012568 [Castilleja foliolosa]|uniref:BTB domain-containing protein n=1 Tax=Castilleja foliolosa TaxID=1961234 RepID=A0ABD3DHM2_9LAMI